MAEKMEGGAPFKGSQPVLKMTSGVHSNEVTVFTRKPSQGRRMFLASLQCGEKKKNSLALSLTVFCTSWVSGALWDHWLTTITMLNKCIPGVMDIEIRHQPGWNIRAMPKGCEFIIPSRLFSYFWDRARFGVDYFSFYRFIGLRRWRTEVCESGKWYLPP